MERNSCESAGILADFIRFTDFRGKKMYFYKNLWLPGLKKRQSLQIFRFCLFFLFFPWMNAKTAPKNDPDMQRAYSSAASP
jgi:hypothetical protein